MPWISSCLANPLREGERDAKAHSGKVRLHLARLWNARFSGDCDGAFVLGALRFSIVARRSSARCLRSEWRSAWLESAMAAASGPLAPWNCHGHEGIHLRMG